MLSVSSIRILPLLLLAGLLTGCEEPPLEEPIRPVLATKVGDVEGFQRDRFPGRAKAKEETNLWVVNSQFFSEKRATWI